MVECTRIERHKDPSPSLPETLNGSLAHDRAFPLVYLHLFSRAARSRPFTSVTSASFLLVFFSSLLPKQGEILAPGDRVQAVERFTPVGVDAGIVFIKMAEGRGWVPIKRTDVGP